MCTLLGFTVWAGGPSLSAVEAGYEELAVKDGGTLTGVVRFNGTAPKLEPRAVNKNRDV